MDADEKVIEVARKPKTPSLTRLVIGPNRGEWRI